MDRRALLAGLLAAAVLLMAPRAAHATTATSSAPAARCTAGSQASSAAGTPLASYYDCGPSRPLSHDAAIHFCRTAQRVRLGAAGGLVSTFAGTAGQQLVGLMPLTCTGTAPAQAAPWTWHVEQVARHYSRPAPSRHGEQAAHVLHLPAYVPLGAQPVSANATLDVPQLLGKVLVVFVLLFLCLRVLKAVMPRLNGAGGGTAGAMVLHTEPIGPKWSLQVLDLGLRLVLVAVSGTSITTLATIDDEAEMAELRARYAPKGRKKSAPRTETGTAAPRPSFAEALALTSRRALGRSDSPATERRAESEPVARQWEQELAAAMAAALALQHDSQEGDPVLSGALESLRSLRRQVERR